MLNDSAGTHIKDFTNQFRETDFIDLAVRKVWTITETGSATPMA
jgi:hypothetical protein